MLTHLKPLIYTLLFIPLWHFGAHGQCGTVDFSASNTTGCAPLAVSLSGKNIPTGAKVEWNLGGGFFIGTDTAFKYFTKAGKIDISLRITLKGQTTPCTTVVKKDYIEVLPKPKIKLWRSDSLLCNGAGSVTLIDSTAGVASRTWIFDGTTQSTTGTTITKSVGLGDHSVNLLVKNSYGCQSVYKNNAAIGVYSTIRVEICGNISQTGTETVGNFTGNVLNSSLKPIGYDWSFPGATPSSSTSSNPKGITYKAPIGTNKVTMNMKFPGGCVYTFEKDDYIKPFLSVDDDTACIKQVIQVTNLAADGGRSDFNMSFPGANFIGGDVKKTFKVSYFSTGSKSIDYSYKYNSDKIACQTTVKTPGLVVVEGPQARAFSNDKTDCRLDSVLIQSNSVVPTTGTNLYYWSIYDKDSNIIKPSPYGPKKNLSSFKMKFDSNGVYSIFLRVENTKNGCKDSLVLKNYLRLTPPQARIKFADSVLCADDQLVMESKSVPPPTSQNPYTYSWLVQHVDSSKIKFDAAAQKFSRRLTMPGLYTVRLIVKSNSACSDTLLLEKYVEVQGIIAEMNVDSTDGCAGFSTDVSSTIKFQYPPTSSPQYFYAWDVFPKKKKTNILAAYADSTKDKTSVTFYRNACYSLSLDINDIYGCKKRLTSKSICIGNKANFGWDIDTLNQLCLNEPFPLVDSSAINPRIYSWSVDKPGLEFSDPTISAPLITFKNAGKYQIKLVVSSGAPAYCKDSIVREIEIKAPEAKFKIDKPITNCAPQQIIFTNESKNANAFKWIYGDGGTSHVTSTDHIYLYTTNSISGFTAKLVAYNAGVEECADTFSLTTKVRIIGPTPLFSADTLRGCDTALVTYSNLTSPINADYVFDYGDGSVPDSNKMRPHTYTFNSGPGVDSVMYFPTIVASSDGCDAYFSDTVIIYRTAKASFTADTLEGCRPLKVTLINQSQAAQKFYWDLWNDNTMDSINQDTVVFELDTVGKFGVSLSTQVGTCISTYKIDSGIKVSVAPRARFELSSHSICDSANLTFTNKTFPITSKFVIDYGDGSPNDTNTIGTHLYKIPDSHPDDSIIYYPVLTAASFGCDNSYMDTVVVYRSPKVDFSIDSSVGCQPFTITLVNKTTANFGFDWDFYSDGNIDLSNKDTLQLLLDTVGFFGVSLTANYRGGCISTKKVDSIVQVVDLPVPSFTMDTTAGCDSITVNFTNTTAPAFTSYSFNFGDGSLEATDTIPQHTFYFPATAPGDSIIFSPKLTGTRVVCKAEFNDTVVVYKSPVANFSIDTTYGCQPMQFTLYNTSTPVSYTEWDIYNNGLVDSINTDTLAFSSDTVGQWSVRLFTRYVGGCTSTKVVDSFFRVFGMPQPQISFDTLRGCDTTSVNFTTNNPADSFIIVYGNGLTDTNVVNMARYAFPATSKSDSALFFINYKVYNPELAACEAVMIDTVYTFRSPTAGFKADTLEGCSPMTITFSDTTARAVAFDWDFNDDGIFDDSTKTASTVLDSGRQTIGLMVTSVEGCTNTLYKKNYVNVHLSPVAKFTASRRVSCPNSEISFIDRSVLDTNIATRTWSFGIPTSGDTLVVPNPMIAYHKMGQFLVKLTVVDSHFCKATDSFSIQIVNLDTPDVVNFTRLTNTVSTGNSVDWKSSPLADFLYYELVKVGANDSTKSKMSGTSFTDAGAGERELVKYYLQVTDSCNNKSLLSSPISRIVVSGDNQIENVLRLRWKFLEPNNFKTFRIYRRYPDGKAWKLIDSIAGSAKVYLDSTACDSGYVYRVEGVTTYNGTSLSNEVKLKAFFTKKNTPLKMYRATVQGDSVVRLDWERNTHAGQRKYVIDRAGADKLWQIGYDSAFVNHYIDTAADVRKNYFHYRVYVEDFCGNISPISNWGTSILLHGNDKSGNVALSWNEYEGWPAGYKFALQVKFGNGKFENLATFDNEGLSYTDNDLHSQMDTPWCYRVVAIQATGRQDSSFSNIYCDYFTSNIYIPNAFSPNDDGVNDFFILYGDALRREDLGNLDSYSLLIFDRWGEILFESDDPTMAWDGKKDGEVLPLGQYTYLVKIKEKDGNEINETGPVFIIR
ncbi:PKD domain-containing protein [bacterium]|nr:PKD domain-containing protein [bacterium]